MKKSRDCAVIKVLLLLLFCVSLVHAVDAQRGEDGFVRIFDGRSLENWSGDAQYWSVQDGAITGVTDGSLKMNHFLTWTGSTLRNFELRIQVKVTAGGNSGLQYRGMPRPDLGSDIVTGYQCDVVANNPNYNGMLYEERGRRILSHTGERVIVDTDGQPWVIGKMPVKRFAPDQWHEYRVLVRGNHHQHWIDGHETADLIDLDAQGRALEGVLAVQVHVGPAMTIQYRDIRLKQLSDDLPLLTADDVPIPETAYGVRPQGRLPKNWKAPIYGEQSNIAHAKPDTLAETFKNPPASAKPRTWMHAMSGNMSKAGMTKDLEAMAEAGIGGIILFNVTHGIPKGKVLFNSDEHTEITRHAAMECERLGLSFGLHNCDGWTSSGGPWVTPAMSMKQVVHSETIVKGGREVSVQLPAPTARHDFYRDIAVLAYPALVSELADTANKPVVTSSDSTFDVALGTDGKADIKTRLNGSPKTPAWVQFDYGRSHTIRSVYINGEKAISVKGDTWLATSEDGIHFQKVRTLKLQRQGKREHGYDDTFEEGITARHFRIVTEIPFDISEMRLSATYGYQKMLARTSLFRLEDHRLPDIGTPDSSMVISQKEILNLSAAMESDGTLVTSLPAGDWMIQRFGYTVTGAVNSPASDEGRGLEVDKMNRAALKIHYDAYVGKVIEASQQLAPTALQYMEIDSYEVGGQNWTQGYEDLFKEQHGYDLIPFLPLYAGRFVDNAATSEDVCWDIRRFNSHLMTENYFAYFTELCHQDGLISYIEPYSFNAAFNELDAGKHADIPMGEFWMHQRYQTETAVSSGRIYGKKVISAESFPARPELNWNSHPGFMKLTGDKAWTLGINEFMFHRFAHQANTNVIPGMTMSQWGSHIDRTQTWWNSAGKAWFNYIARGSHLLRQGNPVSDLLVFVGDGASSSIVQRSVLKPAIPMSINYDCINADALINRVSVRDRQLTLPDGTQYQALVLFNAETLTLATAKKISVLAHQGVVIIGKPAQALGGYAAKATDHATFKQLISKVWELKTTYTQCDWDKIYAENSIPHDLVIADRQDISYIHRRTSAADIYFFYNPDTTRQTFDCCFNVQGRIPELWDPMNGEIRKLARFTLEHEQVRVPVTLNAEGSAFVVFRETARDVDPVVSVAGQYAQDTTFSLNEQSKAELTVSKNGKYAVQYQSGRQLNSVVDDVIEPVIVTGPWQVSFDKFYGYDATLEFPHLIDWKDHASDEVKYYSGTATYRIDFNYKSGNRQSNKQVMLDLGQVEVAARVIVNGRDKGVLWKAPYCVDISDALVDGNNELTLEVTNVWTNRLIGDAKLPDTIGYKVQQSRMPDWYTDNQKPPANERLTFTVYPHVKASDSLVSSGLMGPVRIVVLKTIVVD
ncbi:glycosyl hydrolase [Planctomycetota bacterium]